MKTKMNFIVQASDVDNSLQIRLPNFENCIIQASDDGVNKVGLSTKYLRTKYNASWVLLRLTFKLDVLPKYREEFTIETWAENNELMMTKRNYRFYIVKNGVEQTIGEGSSVWTIIDIDKRQRSKEPFCDDAWEKAITAEPVSLQTIKVKELFNDNPIVKNCMVEYSDIDLNNHFNSCKYLQYILNTCDTLTTLSPIYVDIKYSHELMRGEKFSVFAANKEDTICYKIMSDSGVQSCSAVISRKMTK